ncbi:CocE/NonD family hydrolase C-terminal non-catalytic domain-containing protein [Streptosporangium sp. G11]|uniref:CocE/NonD family hydrolase C-terminal non-catalytic domain-containing protein n=1 Tax=Streptosporangium sp. G11 TaxID=3436926 RepID=UPI003EB95298
MIRQSTLLQVAMVAYSCAGVSRVTIHSWFARIWPRYRWTRLFNRREVSFPQGLTTTKGVRRSGASSQVIARGIMDTQNHRSLSRPTPLTPGKSYQITWSILPQDYEFKAGHRLGPQHEIIHAGERGDSRRRRAASGVPAACAGDARGPRQSACRGRGPNGPVPR